MNKQKVKQLALANGFKLKEQADGSMDLDAYVYDFANTVEHEAKNIPDGFVIVPLIINEQTKQKMLKVFNESDRFLNCENMYKAMIEVQEQAND